MAAMKLEKKWGNFELWSSGPHTSSYVAVASGEGAFRVGVVLMSSIGKNSFTSAQKLFNSLVAGYEAGVK